MTDERTTTEGADEGELVGWITQWPSLPLLGWSYRRFLVLEHGTVLVYDSEEAWQLHHQPGLVLDLTFDSTITRSRRFGQPCLYVTTPEGTIVFSPEAEDGEEHAAAELWLLYLSQWVSLLQAEHGDAPAALRGAAAEAALDERIHNRLDNAIRRASETADAEAGIGSVGSTADVVAAAGVGYGGDAATAGTSDEEEAKDSGRSGPGSVPTARPVRFGRTPGAAAAGGRVAGGVTDGGGEAEENAEESPQSHLRRGWFFAGGGGGGGSPNGSGRNHSSRGRLSVRSSSRFDDDGGGGVGMLGRARRLLLQRRESCRECKCIWCREERGGGGTVGALKHDHHHDGFFHRLTHRHQQEQRTASGISGLSGVSVASGSGRGLGGSSGSGGSSGGGNPNTGVYPRSTMGVNPVARRAALRARRRRGNSSHRSRRHSVAGGDNKAGANGGGGGGAAAAGAEAAGVCNADGGGGDGGDCKGGAEDDDEGDEYHRLVVKMWEQMVVRFLGLQAARGGDLAVVKSVLERYPDHPDKTNMFRAAVRFKHYVLVEYFLDVQKMDVNLTNTAGMPLAWFAIMHISRNDGGVMLRYLESRGADVSRPSKWGQTVLHLVATSEPKVAIPILRYLSQQHGLELHSKDMFGSLPLHWAALFGHLETVKWLSDETCYVMGRCNWAWMFREMQYIQIIRPEHLGAVRQWRARGLDKFATAVTPLGVAVLHNHEEVAKWLMGHDPKAGKGDIQTKRRALFADECRDLLLVSRTWPELLPDVLDGFCTNVRDMAGAASDARRTGWQEKRYDIKLLFGRPDAKPEQTPLSILLETGYAPLFELRVVQLVVALKWQIFGRMYYLYELTRYMVLCLAFVLGFIVFPTVNSTSGAAARVACWLLTLYNLVLEEGREMWASPSLREYLWSGWNVQSLVAYLLVMSTLPLYVAQWGEAFGFGDSAFDGNATTMEQARRMVVAPAALFLFLRFMEHLAVWRTTGVLIAVVRMMFLDTIKWSVLFLLFQAAFDVAFFGLLRGEDGYTSMGQTIITVFAMSMGQIETMFSTTPALNAMAAVLVIAFTLLVSVLYINLLVAMMTTSYDVVLKAASAQALMNRVETLLKWEGIMSAKERQRAFRQIAPGSGRRAHLTLKNTFEGSATEVFIYEEEVTVVEPAVVVRQDNFAKLSSRLDDLSAQVTRLAESVRRGTLASGGSSSSGSGVAAGRAFGQRVGISGIRSRSGGNGSGRGLFGTGGGGGKGGGLSLREAAGRVLDGSARVSAEEIDAWRDRANEISQRNKSRAAIVKAQAVVRGHLERKKLRAIFETAPPEEDEEERKEGGGRGGDVGGQQRWPLGRWR